MDRVRSGRKLPAIGWSSPGAITIRDFPRGDNVKFSAFVSTALLTGLLLGAMQAQAADKCCSDKQIDLLASKNLSDWDYFLVEPDVKKEDVWSFTDDGLLRCKGKPLGYLATKQEFKNFKLIVEWRWPGKPSNSGVLLRVTGKPQGLPCCIEAQLKSGSAGDMCGMHGKVIKGEPMWEKNTDWGALVHGVPKKLAAEKELGQWNKYVITAVDGDIKLELNGQQVNHAFEADTTPGKIGFQSEGDVIEFRTIKITPLD